MEKKINKKKGKRHSDPEPQEDTNQNKKLHLRLKPRK